MYRKQKKPVRFNILFISSNMQPDILVDRVLIFTDTCEMKATVDGMRKFT